MTAIKTGTGEGSRGEFRAMLDLAHAGPTAVTIRYELTGPEGAPLIIVAGESQPAVTRWPTKPIVPTAGGSANPPPSAHVDSCRSTGSARTAT